MGLLERIKDPQDLKAFDPGDFPQLADEMRARIIEVIARNGGHLASSLGVVEITIALHYCLTVPHDAIVWDVGHQAYAHKLLTGRNDRFDTIRQHRGLSGFPNKDESRYDPFTVGHSSTSISTALGLLAAKRAQHDPGKVVALIGDAALAGGMAFEALNHAGHLKNDLVVILNDNELSISPTVGALSGYLNKIISAPRYNKVRQDLESLLKRVPWFGFRVFRAARRLEEGLKHLLVPGLLFEELGFRYFGPLDGHNTALLVTTISNVLKLREPVMLHVITRKGKGYPPAESAPQKFHSSAVFDPQSGKHTPAGVPTYTAAFGKKIVSLARSDERIVGITAAMPEGTGLLEFSQVFPDRFYDVGIAEGHAAGFAAGLARGGRVPVVAVYSTFLQRAYDQLIHDVALQGLHVVFCVDRAGIVGEDGPTHHGAFDLAYLRTVPAMTVLAPATIEELDAMMEFAVYNCTGPVALRYPRGGGPASLAPTREPIVLGRPEVLARGADVCLIGLGTMAALVREAGALLEKKGIRPLVLNARFAKPFDEPFFVDLIGGIKRIYTLEEGTLAGGFGSGIRDLCAAQGLAARVSAIGFPDRFIEHGDRETLLSLMGMTASQVAERVLREIPRGGLFGKGF